MGERLNGGKVEWQKDIIIEWCKVRVVEPQNGRKAELPSGRKAEWQEDGVMERMAERKKGGLT
jgi:hypothetical protein